jgi:hypothetical protein
MTTSVASAQRGKNLINKKQFVTSAFDGHGPNMQFPSDKASVLVALEGRTS